MFFYDRARNGEENVMDENLEKQHGEQQPDIFQRFLVDLYDNALARVGLYEYYYRSYSFWCAILRSLSFLISVPITDSFLRLKGISFDSEVIDEIIFWVNVMSGIVFLCYLVFDVFLGLSKRCSKFESLIEDVRDVRYEVRMLWYELYGEGKELDEDKRRRYFLLLNKMDRICSEDNDAIIWWKKRYEKKLEYYMERAEVKTTEILFGIIEEEEEGGESDG